MVGTLVMLASLADSAAASACNVELTVEAKTAVVDISASSMVSPNLFEVTIRNLGTETITLVNPGDGSEKGWRTPIVTWEMEHPGGAYEPPQMGRCGNVNALHPDEVFDLQPGESRVLTTWVPAVHVTQLGTYKLRLRYENDPLHKWVGIPLGKHDADAIKRIQGSTACVAVSNQVTIEAIGTLPPRVK